MDGIQNSYSFQARMIFPALDSSMRVLFRNLCCGKGGYFCVISGSASCHGDPCMLPIMDIPGRAPKRRKMLRVAFCTAGFSNFFPWISGSTSPQLHCIVPVATTVLPDGTVYTIISAYLVLP